MIKESVTLRNDRGLHFRPANVFADAMSKYECDVRIAHGNKNANGKSLNGVDERDAISNAANLIMTGMGERVPAIC